jgi:hypothetical protein
MQKKKKGSLRNFPNLTKSNFWEIRLPSISLQKKENKTYPKSPLQVRMRVLKEIPPWTNICLLIYCLLP